MLAGAARQVYNSPIGRLQQTLYPLHIMPYSATLLTKDIKKC